MSNHTPGPWEVLQDSEYESIHGIWTTTPIRTYIARTCFAPASTQNSKLIAAAPDMLEALQDAIRLISENSHVLLNSDSRTGDVFIKSAKAIKKATL